MWKFTYTELYIFFPSTTGWFCNRVLVRSNGNVNDTPTKPATPPLTMAAKLKNISNNNPQVNSNKVF